MTLPPSFLAGGAWSPGAATPSRAEQATSINAAAAKRLTDSPPQPRVVLQMVVPHVADVLRAQVRARPVLGPGDGPARRGVDPAPDPEVDSATVKLLTDFVRFLAPPAPAAPRSAAHADTIALGRRLFGQLGCASCHTPAMRTGTRDVPSLSRKTIQLYSDLLLHDMGPGLADGRPDGLASGSEWRTAPLWGIGLVPVVNGHTRFLHDGRARDLAEAILWHGGEARASRERFRLLGARERRELVAVCRTLLDLGVLQRVVGDEEAFVQAIEDARVNMLLDKRRFDTDTGHTPAEAAKLMAQFAMKGPGDVTLARIAAAATSDT